MFWDYILRSKKPIAVTCRCLILVMSFTASDAFVVGCINYKNMQDMSYMNYVAYILCFKFIYFCILKCLLIPRTGKQWLKYQ
jgi:hypothetical protein